MRDACKRVGVSDVALAKVCRRLDVPRPRQGYWLRVSLGESLPKMALPAAGPGDPSKWEGKRWVEPTPDLVKPAAPPPIALDPVDRRGSVVLADLGLFALYLLP